MFLCLSEMLMDKGKKQLYVRGLERAALATGCRNGEVAHAEQLPVFPDPGVGIIGTDFSRITPGMDGNKSIGEGGGDMHRAAVDADGEARAADEPDKLQDSGMIEQIDAVIRHRHFAPGSSDEHDAPRR